MKSGKDTGLTRLVEGGEIKGEEEILAFLLE